MRIVCWNMRRANIASHAAWSYLEELGADIALLQEVAGIPEQISAKYESKVRKACTKQGTEQKFGTVILAKGAIGAEIVLSTEWDWVNLELERFRGNLVAHDFTMRTGQNLRLCSAYCPAWPIDPDRISEVDSSVIKLENNPDVWITELLWAALKSAPKDGAPWLVGGDLNSSVTFDYHWSNAPRGNQEIQDRMEALGFLECLRAHQGQLTPTFRNATGGRTIHQMDHLFAGGGLRDQLKSCVVGDKDRVFSQGLSDHLPIIADFGEDPDRRG